MKYCEFPIGYPTLLARETFANMQPWTKPEDNQYKGIIFCRVRAPPTLKRPLLPHRTPDGRLVFPLCRNVPMNATNISNANIKKIAIVLGLKASRIRN